MEPGSIYVSVPLGAETDPATGVRPLKPGTTNASRVTAALCREIEARAPALKGQAFDVVSFGPGASYLTLDQLYRLIQALYDNFSITPVEQTLAAHAGTVDGPKAKVLRESGFDRIELVQGKLAWSDADVAMLRETGFEAVGALASYEVEAGRRALGVETLLRLEPDHIALDFGGGAGTASGFDLLQSFRFYRDRLSSAFANYALHSFARPGMESKHLLSGIGDRPRVGVGPGARTCVGDDELTGRIAVGEYVSAVEAGSPAFEDPVPARVAQVRNRLSGQSGMPVAESDPNKCRLLAKRGLVQVRSGSVFLTDQGVLALETISRELAAG